MANNLIASKLIESVRDRAMIPDDISVYTDQAILSIINEEMNVGLLDTLLTLHEEHLVTFQDIEHTGEDTYVIPYRAVGNKLRDLMYANGKDFWELSRVSLEELSDYRFDSGYSTMGNNLFYVQGDEIKLINPSFSYGSKLRMFFHISPNSVVLEKECAKITSIDRTTGIIQFNDVPNKLNSLTQIDFIQNRTPNKILGFDVDLISVSIGTRSITFNPSDIPKRLQVGDYVCAPQESPYPNIPTELHPVLAQRAAVYILEALGDGENIQIARGKLAQVEKSVQKILDDRVEGAPRKIKNRYSTLNNSSGFSRSRTSRRRL